MGFATVGDDTHSNVSSLNKHLRPITVVSAAKKRLPPYECEWPLTDVSSDLTIELHASKFLLHKFPLVSRSGKIRRMLMEAKEQGVSRITLDAFPGEPEAFDLAAKFCYGIKIDITCKNVAMLRCAAHYLEMTEDYSEKNLEVQTETFLKLEVLPSISTCIDVLHQCETLLPVAQDIKLVSRIINAIAANACKEQPTVGMLRFGQDLPIKSDTSADGLANNLAILSLDFFKRVVLTLHSKGVSQDMTSKILIRYSQNLIQGTHEDTESRKKQRIAIETVVELLPTASRRSCVPIAFLSGLLKATMFSSASSSCRSDLERRIGLRLDRAILEDILIPADPSILDSVLFDTDTVQRIVSNFLNLDVKEDDDDDDNLLLQAELEGNHECESPRSSPNQSSIFKVSKLLDSYLVEIAVDANLSPAKFIAMAELLPDYARATSDTLYKAIDLFLKIHPNIRESERHRLCKTIDCQKLSEDGCSHAAQNERLPVQMAVQVLYFEQMRLRNAMNGGDGRHPHPFFGSIDSQKTPNIASSGAMSPRDNYASVRRENRELKMEVARMRMRLNELEKDHMSMKQELIRSHTSSNIINCCVKKLGKLNSLFWNKDSRASINRKRAQMDNRFLFFKNRRHSVS